MIQHTYDPKEHLLTLAFGTDILSTNVGQLEPALREIFARDEIRMASWQRVHLDLREVRMIDSMGINLLISLLRTATDRKAKVSALITRHNLHRLFLFTRLDKKIELHVQIPDAPADNAETGPAAPAS